MLSFWVLKPNVPEEEVKKVHEEFQANQDAEPPSVVWGQYHNIRMGQTSGAEGLSS
jgi:hypothetical protein